MQKYEILNARLRSLLVRAGYRDHLTITDAGYNIPLGREVVGLVLLPSLPAILQVLDGILDEFSVEGVYLSERIRHHASKQLKKYEKRFRSKCSIMFVKDKEIDNMMESVKGVARTGNYNVHCPDIILQTGCTYDD